MVGQIPDTNILESPQEMDADNSFSDKNFDSLSSNSNDVTDDISMEDDNDDEEEEENIEDSVNLSSSLCNSPKSTCVSSLSALENQMKTIDFTYGIKSLSNGFNDNSNSKGSEKSPKVCESPSASPVQTHFDGTMIDQITRSEQQARISGEFGSFSEDRAI